MQRQSSKQALERLCEGEKPFRGLVGHTVGGFLAGAASLGTALGLTYLSAAYGIPEDDPYSWGCMGLMGGLSITFAGLAARSGIHAASNLEKLFRRKGIIIVYNPKDREFCPFTDRPSFRDRSRGVIVSPVETVEELADHEGQLVFINGVVLDEDPRRTVERIPDTVMANKIVTIGAFLEGKPLALRAREEDVYIPLDHSPLFIAGLEVKKAGDDLRVAGRFNGDVLNVFLYGPALTQVA